jgi:hypothetical protein
MKEGRKDRRKEGRTAGRKMTEERYRSVREVAELGSQRKTGSKEGE